MNVKVDTQTFVRFWLVLIGFAVGILLIYKARTALILVLISIFLALALNLPVSIIAKRLPGRSRLGASVIAYVVVVALLGLLIFAVIPPIIAQSINFIGTVPDLITNASSRISFINDIVTKYHLQPQADQLVNQVKSSLGGVAASVGNNILTSATSILTIGVNGLLVLIFTFFMLQEGPAWINKYWGLYKNPRRLARHKKLGQQLYGVITGYVNGQLTVAALAAASMAFVTFILSLIFHFPPSLALPVAAIIFVLELIPLFGPAIAVVLAGLLLVLNSPWAAAFFVVVYLVYQQIESAYISPTIQGKAVDISGLTVLVSVTIGTTMFGIAGGIIAIPIAGCISILLRTYLEGAREKRIDNESPRKAKLA